MEIVVGGLLLFVALSVLGLLWAAFSLVFWLVTLPFKLLGLVFHGLAGLVVLPILGVLWVVGTIAVVAMAAVFLIPLLPLGLLAAIAWLVFRRPKPMHA